MNTEYVHFSCETGPDPLLAATALVHHGRPARYMLYERDQTFTVAAGVAAELTVRRGALTLVTGGLERTVPWDGDGLSAVADLMRGNGPGDWNAYGWAAFELAYALAGMPDAAGDQVLLQLVIPETELAFCAGSVTGRVPDDARRRELVRLVERSAGEAERLAEAVPRPLEVSGPGSAEYRAAVAGALEEIRQRRLQKVILSRSLEVDFDVDLLRTYLVGRRRNNPARSFLLDFGGLRATGFSPEIVVQATADGRVTTQPLAGTRALHRAPERNAGLREELLSDPKEVFEHAVSVKEAVDELRRICAQDSVAVRDFMTVKPRGSVQHLGSRVSGRLTPGRSAWDALAVLLPAVTASGIPKRASYEVIRRYEEGSRGPYAGAVLAVGADGSMDAALTLRTVYQQDGRTWLRAGAGIVAQSRPAREYEETCEKLRSVADHLVQASGPDDARVTAPRGMSSPR